jgi:hypothetical protein
MPARSTSIGSMITMAACLASKADVPASRFTFGGVDLEPGELIR